MRPPLKPQRVRDPVHNLIEFGTDLLEETMWRVIQTPPFQRLRRVRQLGFSELVYPGATHTRFAHSIGVFHTARRLMRIIERHIGDNRLQFQEAQARTALAAALVHDVGHGMFSHAFEEIGKALDLKMAHHEAVSDLLIRDSEIAEVLRVYGSGFADDVADVIKRGRPGNLYDAVVSSQFDADRLDYMRRDRLMSGVQNSGIDFEWLVANLEIGRVGAGVDETAVGEIDTFILGRKAHHAAETYVTALFQLYPTVYLHKTTRGAEKLFSAVMLRLVPLARDGDAARTGLADNHPLVRFAREPDDIARATALDDTVFWGALPMLAEAPDAGIALAAARLRERRLLKCVDVRARLGASLAGDRPADPAGWAALRRRVERLVIRVEQRLKEWNEANAGPFPRILVDKTARDPYKRFQDSKGPLNQIHIRGDGDRIHDMADHSAVVAALEPFHVFRAYIAGDDAGAREAVEKIMADEIDKAGKDDAEA